MIHIGDALTGAWKAVTAAKASIITGIACVALCLPLGYCKGYEAATDKASAERAAANVTAMKTARTADQAAAVERVDDALANIKQETGLTDAIAQIPDTLPDPTRVALGCQRLRQSGATDATLPAACRPASGDGSQAGAQP